MLWSDAPLAGFSAITSWMPISNDYRQINAMRQQQTPGSLWRDYQELIALRRQTAALCEGDGGLLVQTEECVWFMRATASERIWVAINFGGPVQNPWRAIAADVLYGQDTQWLGKNQILMKRRVHEQTQQ